ncbi:MAG: response regulator [Candidatus Gribaldobacteria bacterium]|nr:response regulator [Candidatus Gribaldobacteria bacterium]
MSKLLIIEDEPLLREMYCQVFAEHGLNVMSAESAEEGLLILEQEAPDLVLLDILLPNASGLEMLEQLRRIPSNIAKTKVVAFSNYDNKIAREKARELGVLDYLIKTEFTPQEIVEKIMSYLP